MPRAVLASSIHFFMSFYVDKMEVVRVKNGEAVIAIAVMPLVRIRTTTISTMKIWA